MNSFRFLFLLAVAFGLTACQTQNGSVERSTDSAATTGHEGMDHSAMGHQMAGSSSYSDVRFLDRMTAHHQMAVEMAQMAPRQGAGAEVLRMAEEVVRSQQAEIDSMRIWRARWFPDEPAPGPMSADEMAAMGMGMDMAALGAARGAAFDRLFQEQMIPHHAGAITMAAEAHMNTERAEVRRLARDIIGAQAREIGEMQARLEAMPSEQ